MTTVTAIIVNWNGAKDTIRCIKSLQGLIVLNCDLSIVVTDNASSDGSLSTIAEALREQEYTPVPNLIQTAQSSRIAKAAHYAAPSATLPEVTLIEANENFGFAGGNNIGVELSCRLRYSDFFWFLNSDTQADPLALATLLNKMANEPLIGMCGSTLIYASDRKTVQSYGGAKYSFRTGRAWSPGAGCHYDPTVEENWIEQRINYVSGAAMFVRAELINNVGPMCEDYFLYNEEIDLAIRSRDRFKLGVATGSIVYHKVGASIGTEGSEGSASRLAAFYQTRSKLLFAKKHTKIYYPMVWLTLLVRSVKFTRSAARRAEAWVILQVLLGKRAANPHWFNERTQGSVPVNSTSETLPA